MYIHSSSKASHNMLCTKYLQNPCDFYTCIYLYIHACSQKYVHVYYTFHRHLSLIGNNLHCEGASELVTALVKVIEGGRESLGPPLSRLHLQDNGIDVLGSKGMFDPIIFTRLLKRHIAQYIIISIVYYIL